MAITITSTVKNFVAVTVLVPRENLSNPQRKVTSSHKLGLKERELLSEVFFSRVCDQKPDSFTMYQPIEYRCGVRTDPRLGLG